MTVVVVDPSIFEASNGRTGPTNILHLRLNFISHLCIRLKAMLSDVFYPLTTVQKFDLGLLQAASTKLKHWKVTNTEIGTRIFYRTYTTFSCNRITEIRDNLHATKDKDILVNREQCLVFVKYVTLLPKPLQRCAV